MKKFTAFLIAAVMIFSFAAFAACKGETVVRIVLDAGSNGTTRQFKHTVGKDDFPMITNGNLAFGGWYYDKELTKPFVLEDDQTTDGCFLYAKWKTASQSSDKVTVTLISNYDGASADVRKIDKGGKLTLPQLTRQDSVFNGWFTEPAGGTQCTNDTVFNQDTVLYAHWTSNSQPAPNTDKVYVTLCPNYEGSLVSTSSLNKGASYTLTAPSARQGYTFDGWYTQPVGGTKKTGSITVDENTVLYAHWNKDSSSPSQPSAHTHDFGDNYFTYVKCSVEGCNVIGRKDSENTFKDNFTYNYTQADKTNLDKLFATLSAQIQGNSVSNSEVMTNWNTFCGLQSNIINQYQIATVMFSVNYNDDWQQKAALIGSAYNDWFKDYYVLLGFADSSKYAESIFQGMDADEKEYCLEQAKFYSSTEDNLQTVADNLADEYNTLLGNLSSESDLPNLYQAYYKYVQANNNIAAQYQNKYANYMDYAYENVYGREYTPEQVSTMRNYVKSTVAPILIKLNTMAQSMQGFGGDDGNLYSGMEDDYAFYESLALDSLFTLDEGYEQGTYDATNYLGNYFKFVNNNLTGSKEINFFKAANNAFKTGSIFTSSSGEEGAYTYYIIDKNAPMMYFDDYNDPQYGYYYSTAFTFVHEFGHYYADVYTNGGDFSMDHAETHSQGDEMLFLAYLSQHCPSGAEYGYKVLQVEQLLNILQTIVQATVVDEFEQAVYSNSYGTGQFKDGIDHSKYGDLYAEIVNSYGSGMSQLLSEDYWLDVVVSSSAYYISYAMSALPSVQLFVKAMTDGLTPALQTYFKLFTACDTDNLSSVDTDSDGEVTYSEALAFAGLASPFSPQMFSEIGEYFDSYSVD